MNWLEVIFVQRGIYTVYVSTSSQCFPMFLWSCLFNLVINGSIFLIRNSIFTHSVLIILSVNLLNILLVTSIVYPLHQILHCFRVGELFFRSLRHDIIFTYNSRNNVSFITKMCITQTFTTICVPYLFSKRNIRILCNAMTSFSEEKQN